MVPISADPIRPFPSKPVDHLVVEAGGLERAEDGARLVNSMHVNDMHVDNIQPICIYVYIYIYICI